MNWGNFDIDDELKIRKKIESMLNYDIELQKTDDKYFWVLLLPYIILIHLIKSSIIYKYVSEFLIYTYYSTVHDHRGSNLQSLSYSLFKFVNSEIKNSSSSFEPDLIHFIHNCLRLNLSDSLSNPNMTLL
jgi:hypothetical protein